VALHGVARLGRRGEARLGWAWRGWAGVARLGEAGRGAAGQAWRGLARLGVARLGRRGMAWRGWAWRGWAGEAWRGKVRRGQAWHGTHPRVISGGFFMRTSEQRPFAGLSCLYDTGITHKTSSVEAYPP
jgi:hypothetical protein